MLSSMNKLFILSVIMLSVIMLSVYVLNVIFAKKIMGVFDGLRGNQNLLPSRECPE